MEDGRLWRRIAVSLRLGTSGAATELLEAIGDPMYAYLSLMLGDRDVATHALADTLAVALGHADRLTDTDRLPGWLFALARHQYQQRQGAVTRAIPDTLGNLSKLADLSADDEAAATAAELAYLAMTRLSSSEREVLVLWALRLELTPMDLGAIFGVHLGVITQVRRRAAANLGRELAAVGLDPRAEPRKLLRTILAFLLGPPPRDRVLYMCTASELADRRRQVQDRAGPFDSDGFPLIGPLELETGGTSRKPAPLWRRRPSRIAVGTAGAVGAVALVAAGMSLALMPRGQAPATASWHAPRQRMEVVSVRPSEPGRSAAGKPSGAASAAVSAAGSATPSARPAHASQAPRPAPTTPRPAPSSPRPAPSASHSPKPAPKPSPSGSPSPQPQPSGTATVSPGPSAPTVA